MKTSALTEPKPRAAAPTRLRPWRNSAVAALVGVAVFVALAGSWAWPARVFAGWVVATVVLLVLPWRVILRSNAQQTRQRAATEDPGAVGVLLISLAASVAGLAASAVLLQRPERFVPQTHVWIAVTLAVVAVTGGWALVHTAFALHYARLYYERDDSPGGLDFPGDDPDDLDFAYFAFTLGMTYQTSDVSINDRAIRHFVLAQSVVSFLYNTVVLALAVSLLFGKLG